VAWSTSARSSRTRGEAVAEVLATSKVSVLMASVIASRYPTGQGSETATEVVIDPAKVHDVFCGDLTQVQSDVIARSQRPISTIAFGEKTGHPAWKDLPVWAAVGTQDRSSGVTDRSTRAGTPPSSMRRGYPPPRRACRHSPRIRSRTAAG
jgi:hypothetical protein